MSSKNQGGLSRRRFLQATATGAAAGALGATARQAQARDLVQTTGARQFDFTRGSSALAPDKVVRSACQFCNSLCGLQVHTKNQRVLSIAGDPLDPVQQGQLCVKAEMMAQLVHNGRRLTRPLKRVSGKKGDPKSRFVPISWDEALTLMARRFLALRDAGQAHTIANRTSGRMARGVGSLIHRMFTMLGSPNDSDVGPVCNDAGGNALAWTFGLGNFTNGYGVDPATGQEDLGASDFFFFLGTNQAETHPVTFAHLLRHRSRSGASLVVVDPRGTPTSAYADVWMAPRPHTDMALVLGMLHHIIQKKLYDQSFLQKHVLGFDQLVQHLNQHGYTTAWAAQTTGLPQAQIEAVAEGFARARAASIFCNAGISHQLGAFDTYRTLAFLSAITGNIGKPGGGCNFMHNTWPGGLELPPIDRALPAQTHPTLPVGPDWFAEAILEGRPYPLKAVVTQGNPLMSSANTEKVRRAYQKLDFYVYTGLFMEESAWYADLILPVTSGLEMETVYMRRDDRAIRWQQQAVPRVGESKPDWEIWIELAHAMAKLDKKHEPSWWTEAFPLAWRDYRVLWNEFARHTPGVAGMTAERMEKRHEPLRWPCPSAEHPGVSTLYMDHPSWYQAAEALGHKGKRFLTASGKVELWTQEMDDKLQVAGHSALPTFYTHPETTGALPTLRYKKELVPNPVNPHALTPKVELGVPGSDAIHKNYPLVGMIGRASVVHFAGVTQWTWAGKQLNGERYIQIHPSAAKAAGIKDGDTVTVESPRGAVQGTAQLWEQMRPDAIFVPNSFGPAQVVGDEMGLPRYKVANILVDDQYFDNLSGQQAYKCFACRVRKA